ncbi:LVIVD repeat-containing protein [Luteimonas aquatica]|uniref:LVIVD repeat-containing protein n=1 Tax=Luteimonas aquatica TaxID=450364 RepID=UPI001F585451|nr:hypothetical protein [Luteimonas aquatica]
MTHKLLAAALLSVLAAAAPASAATAPAAQASASSRPLELSLIRGGAVRAAPIANGRFVYIATGRVLATWDYRRPERPLRLGVTSPAEGAINALTRNGDYLYATWRGHDGTGGVTVYSLVNPARPRLVADLPYSPDGDQFAIGVVAANGHLFLFDNNQGVFVGDLSNPRKPAFSPAGIGVPVQYNKLVAYGNTVYATGRSWLGGTVLDLYDVSNPRAPAKIASHLVDGLDSFSLTPEKGGAVGVGNQLSLFDLSNPQQMVRRGFLDIAPATYGLRLGAYFYSFGYSDGLDVWNIGNADAPRAVGHLDVSSLGGHHALALGDTVLLQTDTDLVHSLDARTPAKPRRVATSWLPGGVGARDIALWRGAPLLLQPNYGFTLNDPRELTPLVRVEADLPPYLQSRSFEQTQVVGDRAYLAAWGYGLLMYDLSNPRRPRESGRLSFPFAATFDVQGKYAYVAKWTNGGLLGVADVSKPETAELVWADGLASQPYRVKADKGYLYIAEGREMGAADTGGLRVYSLRNPADPVLVRRFDQGCGSAFDLSIDSDVSLAYLACESGMQIIDVSKPESPVLVGSYASSGGSDYNKVAQRGDRAWFADTEGLHEFDVSDPARPKLRKTTNVGHQVPQRLFADPYGRLWVLGGETGVQVFGHGRPWPLPHGLDPLPMDGGGIAR